MSEKGEEHLGAELRDVVLGVYLRRNPQHTAPGWEELKDFGRKTWAAVHQALVEAGWTPPGSEGRGT